MLAPSWPNILPSQAAIHRPPFQSREGTDRWLLCDPLAPRRGDRVPLVDFGIAQRRRPIVFAGPRSGAAAADHIGGWKKSIAIFYRPLVALSRSAARAEPFLRSQSQCGDDQSFYLNEKFPIIIEPLDGASALP